MKEIEAIILAGGNGSRMKNVAGDQQKCLLPIDEKPILGQIMDTLVDTFGAVDLKIGIAHKADQVIEFVDKNKPKKAAVTFVPHTPGTEGWGIYQGMKNYIKGDFIAMPGDVIALSQAYSSVYETFLANNVDGAITLSPDIEVVDTHGTGKIENGQVTSLQWPPLQEPEEGELRDMTIWSSNTKFFDILDLYPSPKQSIGVVFMKALEDKRPIGGTIYNKKWIHLGYPADLQKSLK